MASAAEASYYLPPLDQCLEGRQPIVSYLSLYTHLASASVESASVIERVLKDKTIKSQLIDPLSAFAPGGASSKASLDTLTSAVNAPNQKTELFDVAQIKADAIWLSKDCNLDEEAALRVVIIQWQGKGASELLSSWSEEELVSLQANLGASSKNGLIALADKQGASLRGSVRSTQMTEMTRRRAQLQQLQEEQEYLFKTSELLYGLAQGSDLKWSRQCGGRSVGRSHELKLTAGIIWKAKQASSGDDSAATIAQWIVILRSTFEDLLDAASWPDLVRDSEEHTILWTTSQAERVATILKILQLHLLATSSPTLDSGIVANWFELMDATSFFLGLQTLISVPEIIRQGILSLLALITIDFLQIDQTMRLIDSRFATEANAADSRLAGKSYIENEDLVKLITGCLYGAASQDLHHVSPAILAWSLIAQNLRVAAQSHGFDQLEDTETSSPRISRRSSLRDSGYKLTRPEILVQAILDVSTSEDCISALAEAAVNSLNVFDVLSSMIDVLSTLYATSDTMHTLIGSKLTLFQLIRFASPLLSYGSEVIQTLLLSLDYASTSTSLSPQCVLESWPNQPAGSLQADQAILGPGFMTKVVSRYPHELTPFLVCLTAISKSAVYDDNDGSQITRLTDSLTTFTMALPVGFDDYELVQDDDLPNCIQLKEPIPLFHSAGAKSAQSSHVSSALVRADSASFIPAGTIGLVLNETRPFVVSWQHEHSGLEYLGSLLSTLSPSESLHDARNATDFGVDAASDLVKLITTLLAAALRSSDEQAAQSLLGRLSNGLNRNEDIVRVIFDILDDQLQSCIEAPRESTIDFVSSILKVMIVFMQIFPDRVWSYLSRSRLLPSDSNPGAIPAIVGVAEAPAGRYQFLQTVALLYRSLIDDCLKRAVSNYGSVQTASLTRFRKENSLISRVAHKSNSTTLFAFTRTFIDVLQSAPNWRFVDQADRHTLNEAILQSFSKIINLTNTTQATNGTTSNLLTVFEASAAFIITTFLTVSSSDLSFQCILDILVTALIDLEAQKDCRYYLKSINATIAALGLCADLLRAGLSSQKPAGRFLKHLLQALPFIARLHGAQEILRSSISRLLTLLVQYIGLKDSDPAPLLGHLSSSTASAFLSAIGSVDSPLQSLEAEALTWDLLSAIVSNSQQWLAIRLLTGSAPRERLQQRDVLSAGRNSVIRKALDRLSAISTIPPRRAIAMLAFLSSAQAHWNWVSSDIVSHPKCLNSMLSWLSELTPNKRQTDKEACIRNAYENQMASFIADIIARVLHNTNDEQGKKIIKDSISKLAYLRENGVSVNGYNQSLHNNLNKNFVQKFPACKLEDLKRGPLRSAQLGADYYYYDIELADQVLSFDPSWRRSKGQGFVDEIARANVNFSLVDSQIAMLKSWKNLILQLARSFGQDAEVQKLLVDVTNACLQANMATTIPAQLFEDVNSLRADLAFALLQSLARSKPESDLVKGLLSTAWDAVRLAALDFEVITEDRDAEYYRKLLKILFLALKVHPQDPAEAPANPKKSTLTASAGTTPIALSSISVTLLEIATKVVAVNFRALCTSVHSNSTEDQSSSIGQPSDFVLLTALLQLILQRPGAAHLHQQLSTIIFETGLVRYALSLYSWSDSLSPGDPIYGELAVLFLLSLSRIQPVAEQMAVDGVLPTLSSANVSQVFRARGAESQRGGRGPFDKPHRAYNIWAKGILPLCLNILEAVGPGVAAEVANFLNTFEPQLRRAESDMAVSSPASIRDPYRGSITLCQAAEVHLLSLLAMVIEQFKAQGAGVGINPLEVESLAFDRAAVKEALGPLLKNRRSLRDRIVPFGEREVAMSRAKASAADSETRLEEVVVEELKAASRMLDLEKQ